jgi:BlaI family transcriptional regulator, penicillinase repressor
VDDRRALPGGKLEYAVLAALWDGGAASVREVHARVGAPLGLVQTTTARVLDRLHAKGLIAREKNGKRFDYRALAERPDVDRARLSAALSGFLMRAPSPAMASLVDAIESIDPTLVDELARAVELRRRSR